MDVKFRRLQALYDVEIIENASGAEYTSFKSGGSIRYLLRPFDAEGLQEALAVLTCAGIPYKLLGNGTNTLVSDKGYDGAAVTVRRIKSVHISGDTLYASGGVSYPVAAAIARDNHLSGLEFAAGIPGTVGGAVAMNAGAYGTETKDKVIKIDILNGDTVETLGNADMNFTYRNSNAQRLGYIILGASFKLNYCDRDDIAKEMKRLDKLRAAAQPEEASAGSTFKRADGVSPAVYIEKCGLKGARVGGAQISGKHANFIINAGGATTNDYCSLRDRAAEEVYKRFGITLNCEVKLIGE